MTETSDSAEAFSSHGIQEGLGLAYLDMASPKAWTKWVFVVLGWVLVAVAVIGIFVPLLPTTPFLLLAAFLFSKGSTRFHFWLLRHPRLGPPILDWQRSGVIRPKAKLLACMVLLGTAGILWNLDKVPSWGKNSAFMILASVALFLLSRPSRPTHSSEPGVKRSERETLNDAI